MLSCPVKSTFHPRLLTPLVSALTSFPALSQKIAFLTPLEPALTDTPSSNPFRFRSYKNTRGWGSPNRDLRKLCTEAQKRPPVSPFPATLTHSLSRNPFVCHSYANTWDGYATASANLNLYFNSVLFLESGGLASLPQAGRRFFDLPSAGSIISSLT